MKMIVKGDQVNFIKFHGTKAHRAAWYAREVGHDTEEDEDVLEDIKMPKNWVFWNDESGKSQPRHHFFLNPESKPKQIRKANHGVLDRNNHGEMQLWEAYYGESVTPRTGRLAIPDTTWKLVERIDAIQYRRKGKHDGLYEHKFSRQVPLHEARRGNAFYLDLGRDFVADERGFVRP